MKVDLSERELSRLITILAHASVYFHHRHSAMYAGEVKDKYLQLITDSTTLSDKLTEAIKTCRD